MQATWGLRLFNRFCMVLNCDFNDLWLLWSLVWFWLWLVLVIVINCDFWLWLVVMIASLAHHNYCLSSLSLFYCYYHGHCSQDFRSMMPRERNSPTFSLAHHNYSLSLFYRYYHRLCSQELENIIPEPLRASNLTTSLISMEFANALCWPTS